MTNPPLIAPAHPPSATHALAPARPLIVAHRALSPGVAENSLAGIVRAAERGADLVEIDVRRSLDGVPFLIHDPFLGRTTTGVGFVRATPAAVLRRLPLRGARGERLPTLAAALAVLPAGLGLALHLKDRGSLRAALAVVRAAGLEGKTWLWLHGPVTVRAARELAPTARPTMLEAGARSAEEWMRHLRAAREAGASGVSVPWRDLTPALLAGCRAMGLRAFSVNHRPEEIVTMVDLGLGGVIADDPAVVVAALAATPTELSVREGPGARAASVGSDQPGR